ncbi:MAG: 3'-5' exonuclease [Actinomycetota bacterium]|nr:3'-5' exonuclease [Actinomycetota bacterium]
MSDSVEILDTPIERASLCAVDVETSGLTMPSRVVEIGAIKFDLSGKFEEFQTLINPCESISQETTRIHGITDDMVRLAPKAAEALPGFLNFISSCALIAHNARFDVRMLSREMFRSHINLPCSPVLCTISMARKILPGLPDYRLSTLALYLGINEHALHNALPDARAAKAVFEKAAGKIGGNTPLREIPGVLGFFNEIAPRDEYAPRTGDMNELEYCTRMRIPVEIEFVPGSKISPVIITPHYIFSKNGKTFIRGYCHRNGVAKTFRLDSVLAFRQAWPDA